MINDNNNNNNNNNFNNIMPLIFNLQITGKVGRSNQKNFK